MPALSQNLNFTVATGSSVQVAYPTTATTTLTFISDKVKGDGYYGNSDGVHTVAYKSTYDFAGSIYMQASLATDPSTTDWFNVAGTTSTYTTLNIRTTSTVNIYNFIGNFVWVRGYISISQGTVQSIKYNH
jgi:hypothetical protein